MRSRKRRFMIRAYIALFAAPLLISLLFREGAAIVAIVMLSITAFIAAPLLFFFNRRNWLSWWQCALAGCGCALVFAALFTAAASSGWADIFGLQSTLAFAAVGGGTAILFWWLGVFRNPAFPRVSIGLPFSMLLIIPVAVLGVLLHQSFRYEPLTGRILTVQGEPPTRSLAVRLSSGQKVEVDLIGDSRPSSVMLNQCWHLAYHWSSRRLSNIYSLTSPFGGESNDC